MEPMTPEERFTKIENFLNTVAEHQARQAETLARHDAEIERNTAGIRDLIVVSRSVLDSQMQTTAQIQALASEMSHLRDGVDQLRDGVDQLREAQQATDDKLHALIDTVDRIIRNQKN